MPLGELANDSMRWAMRSILCLLIVLGAASLGRAEDLVKLKNGQTIRGTLQRHDERGVLIRDINGVELEYRAEQVGSVEAPLDPAHVSADESLASGNHARAVADYQRALGSEQRPWAASRIRAGLVRALRGEGRMLEAGRVFLDLARQRADPEVMVLAPLIWLPGEAVNAEALAAGRAWLDQPENAVAGLLAGSWLLETPERARAAAVLDRLEKERDARVSMMASVQRWRIRVDQASPDEVAALRQLVESMPSAVRGGAYHVLGRAYAKAGQPAEAALAFLWVPLVYDSSGNLAADALLQAARASRQAGFDADAAKLTQELIRRFPGSRWAKEAQAE